ncbi:unnamed protein product [Aphanomyces euteiches]
MKKYFSYCLKMHCDWKKIRAARVDKLADFEDLIAWTSMLSGILGEFVLSAKGKLNLDFWKRLCHNRVDALFNQDGQWQGGNRTYYKRHVEYLDEKPDSAESGRRCRHWSEEVTSEYPLVEMRNIPAGYLTVELAIDDNGAKPKALIFAGHMAYQGHNVDTIAPHLIWAIALKSGLSLADEDFAKLPPRYKRKQKSGLAARMGKNLKKLEG